MAAEELLKEVGHATGAPGSTLRGLRRPGPRRAAVVSCPAPTTTGRAQPGERPLTTQWRRCCQARMRRGGRSLQTALAARGTERHAGVALPQDRSRRAHCAKTGTIVGGIALSGFGTTIGGRAFVFSVLVNGDGSQAATGRSTA